MLIHRVALLALLAPAAPFASVAAPRARARTLLRAAEPSPDVHADPMRMLEQAAASSPSPDAPPSGRGEDALAAAAGVMPLATRADEVKALLESPQAEALGCALVLIASALFPFETLTALGPTSLGLLQLVENAIAVVFAGEFFLRWYSERFRPSWLIEPLSIVDLISWAVLFTPFDLNFLKLLRVLRLQRYVSSVEAFAPLQRALLPAGAPAPRISSTTLQIARVLSSVFTLLFISTGLIYTCEHEVNPQIPDFFVALYFGLTTLTTVGFGDITPVTVQGKLVVCFSILVGIAVIPLQLTSLAEALIANAARADEQQLAPAAESVVCGVCGERAHRRDARFCFRCGDSLMEPDPRPPPSP